MGSNHGPTPYQDGALPLSYGGKLCGGEERDRTDDLLLAKQLLSQLSYIPT